ncbi:hypothetical protein EDI_228630 [Entamoeba dispar SAW760]|uniref:Uncharacterized protein n=1 Tax=Entamoeba dispar (strain ATCC PRA-260 / SAW760) TaxID=370354 RepID=B0ELS2_ENTDS|nr:uncharacterized protein EDI_228630 [Entamoeba dispar SAW760]EDR24515.1 hypothetical protein EDI_228630 [Entamoeba dispar SAW760]|eukprot:EDR24515.1 hypothetical protein EDI_228630 [Entamoeba dispar SAW760]
MEEVPNFLIKFEEYLQLRMAQQQNDFYKQKISKLESEKEKLFQEVERLKIVINKQQQLFANKMVEHLQFKSEMSSKYSAQIKEKQELIDKERTEKHHLLIELTSLRVQVKHQEELINKLKKSEDSDIIRKKPRGTNASISSQKMVNSEKDSSGSLQKVPNSTDTLAQEPLLELAQSHKVVPTTTPLSQVNDKSLNEKHKVEKKINVEQNNSTFDRKIVSSLLSDESQKDVHKLVPLKTDFIFTVNYKKVCEILSLMVRNKWYEPNSSYFKTSTVFDEYCRKVPVPCFKGTKEDLWNRKKVIKKFVETIDKIELLRVSQGNKRRIIFGGACQNYIEYSDSF